MTATDRSTGRLLAAALVALAAPVLMLAAPPPAGGQDGGGRLDLVAQTLFVDGDPAEIVVRVGGDDPAPDLEVEVFAPVTDPAALEAAFESLTGRGGRADFRCSQFPDSCEVDASGLLTIRIPDDEVGEFIRRDEGALPVRITMRDDDGDPVQQLTTALVVTHGEPAGRMGVAFVTTVAAPVALQPDQGIDLDVAAVLDQVDAVAHADLPVTVGLTPETLDALDVVAPESLEDLLAGLDGRSLLRSPWVELDEEAWRAAGQSEQVIALYTRGIETVEDHTGDEPTGIVRLDPDATPQTLGLLRTAGATAVIATRDRLTGDDPGPAPFGVLDDNGLAMPAVAVDDRLQDLLAADDPELGAYRTLAMIALEASRPGDHGSLLDLDGIDPVALELVRQGIDDRDELTVREVEDILALDPARTDDGDAVRLALDPAPTPDVTELSTRLRTAAREVDTYAEMVAPETGPVEPLRTLLLTAAADGLADPDAYPAAVAAEVRAGIDGVTIARAERITLTDRRADLPLTVVNDQPLPLTVELVLSSEKVRFPDGDTRTLRLDPGDNPIVIPVETLASGDARVTATVTSPGGTYELATGTIDVRSTAISGLGLLISVAALAVLGAWWIRTIVRVRRGRAAATVAPTPEEHSGPHRGEP